MKGNFPGQKKKRALKKKRQINPLERALNAFERASIKYPNSWGRGGICLLIKWLSEILKENNTQMPKFEQTRQQYVYWIFSKKCLINRKSYSFIFLQATQ